MPLAVLLQTSRVAAEATVARLQALEIDAQVLDEPNVFVKLASGGNYRVHVVVPEEELERARAELARLDQHAGPRVEAMAREIRLGFLLGSLPAVALLLWLFLRSEKNTGLWIAIVPAWLAGLMSWAMWSRLRAARGGSLEGRAKRQKEFARVMVLSLFATLVFGALVYLIVSAVSPTEVSRGFDCPYSLED